MRRPWLPSPRRTDSGLKSGPKKVFPAVVVVVGVIADVADVFVVFRAPGVLLGVSASEPRLSSIAAAADAADGGPVAGEAAKTEVAESMPPFLFLR